MKKHLGMVVALALTANVNAAGLVDFDGTELNLLSYTNSAIAGNGTTNGLMISLETYALYNSSGDAFNPMHRGSLNAMEADGGQVGMPFSISDDSVVAAMGNGVFASDTQGFAGMAHDNNGFFGITDTVNADGPGAEVATFVFDISGLSNISVSADFAAMGDFEGSDSFVFDYEIDGGGFNPLFTSSVNEDGDQTYTMDNPANNPVVINDPLLINGVTLDDNFQTIAAAVAGTGSELTIRLTAASDGGTEGFGFDNLSVVPEPASMVLLAVGGVALLRRRNG